MDKITLFVGLNDKDTKNQEITTKNAYKIAQNLLAKYVGAGTISEALGVYTYEDGTVCTEETIRVEIMDPDEHAVGEYAAALKRALNQESVLEQREHISAVFC